MVVADEGLRPLGDAHHGHHHEGIHVVDDAVADDGVIPQVAVDGVDEEEGHRPGGELRKPGGEAQLEGRPDVPEPVVDGPEVEPRPLAQEVDEVEHRGEELGGARGHCRALHPKGEAEAQEVVEEAVQKTPADDAARGIAGKAIHLHQDLKGVAQAEEDGEGREVADVGPDVADVGLRPAEKAAERVQEEQRSRRDGEAQDDAHHHIQGVDLLRLLPLPPPQMHRNEGGGAYGEDQRRGEHDAEEGAGHIDGAQGHLGDTPGDEDGVHHGVEGEEPLGDHRWDDEAQEIPPQ